MKGEEPRAGHARGRHAAVTVRRAPSFICGRTAVRSRQSTAPGIAVPSRARGSPPRVGVARDASHSHLHDELLRGRGPRRERRRDHHHRGRGAARERGRGLRLPPHPERTRRENTTSPFLPLRPSETDRVDARTLLARVPLSNRHAHDADADEREEGEQRRRDEGGDDNHSLTHSLTASLSRSPSLPPSVLEGHHHLLYSLFTDRSG